MKKCLVTPSRVQGTYLEVEITEQRKALNLEDGHWTHTKAEFFVVQAWVKRKLENISTNLN